MKQILLFILLILNTTVFAQYTPALIDSVFDADSYRVLILPDSVPFMVRLPNVDALEMKSKYLFKGQPGAEEARQAVVDLLPKGDTIYLDGSAMRLIKVDMFGRLICDIYTKNFEHLGFKLTQEGLVWARYENDRTDLKFNTTILEAMRLARRLKRGIWSDPTVVNPIEWRRQYARQQSGLIRDE